MPTPPPLTPEQRQAALLKAAEARRVRAALKEKLKTGALSFEDALELAKSDEVVAKTKVSAVLEALPGMGKVKARRLMEEIHIADSRRLAGLGAKQRQDLLTRLAAG